MGFLNSLGLMQRTKKGWQAPSVRISSSRDRLNWLLSVGERFLVSAPCGREQTDSDGRGHAYPSHPPAAVQEGGKYREGHHGQYMGSWGSPVTPLVWAGTWTSDSHYRELPRTPAIVSLQTPTISQETLGQQQFLSV